MTTHILRFGLLFLLLSSPTPSVFAHDSRSEWAALNREVADLYQKGDYDHAVIAAKQALDLAERSFGPDHVDVALSLNNLALMYKTQKRFAAAEPLYKRSLLIREKALGPAHRSVAESLHNLAALYKAQGEFAAAEPLYKRSLAIWEKTLGPEHPSMATSINNLASLYVAQGDFAAAEPLYKRSLAIREKSLGPDHRSVAESLNNQGQRTLKPCSGDDLRQEAVAPAAASSLHDDAGFVGMLL